METISRSLLTFILNSLWQVPLAAGIAGLACHFMRKGPARHRHAVWVVALSAAILLPLASIRSAPAAPGPRYSPTLAGAPRLPQALATPAPAVAVAAPARRTVSFAGTTASILMAAYLVLVLFRIGRLAWAWMRTVQIRGGARVPNIPEPLERVWLRCQEAFGLRDVALLCSARVSGPVTAGRAIILPESLLNEPSEDVLTTAIGHEMAHIARRDFGWNLVYEAIFLPIGFHPAALVMRRSIERTREMACDELVTTRLIDAGAYARSIVSIASGMMALPRPGYTLGVFDGDILEERLRRLAEHPHHNLKRARLLFASGLAAVALCAVAASTLALTARAQSGAQYVMKQAEAAYNRGGYAQAAELFASAVKLEPANVKAKLLLGNTLLRQVTPGPNADLVLIANARQQYLDALALEPANQTAIRGLTTIAIITKNFDEAHTWALKAIRDDATDPNAYYTAGFVDWSLIYPDYAGARLAAGMRPEDPGNIPDATLRQNLRAKHGARLAEGFQMLQTALQLEPDFTDAMAYLNLLYRIDAGLADSDAKAAELIALADDWVKKALKAKKLEGASMRPSTGILNVDAPVANPTPGPMLPAPPPPPPPTPPGKDAQANGAEAVTHSDHPIQAQALQVQPVHQVAPVYPDLARRAGLTGVVKLRVVIGKEGKVTSVVVVSGVPILVQAAIDAVRQWEYPPALVNGEPVDVTTTVEVKVAPTAI